MITTTIRTSHPDFDVVRYDYEPGRDDDILDGHIRTFDYTIVLKTRIKARGKSMPAMEVGHESGAYYTADEAYRDGVRLFHDWS